MIFYTIVSRDSGRFCGYKRKWHDLWLKRALFRWDTFPHNGEVMIFLYEKKAYEYLSAHPDLPSDCEVKFSDMDLEAPYGHPVVSPKMKDSVIATIEKDDLFLSEPDRKLWRE